MKEVLGALLWFLATVLMAASTFAQSVERSVVIKSVTQIVAARSQTILVRGSGFGSHDPYDNENTPCLEIRDETTGWAAGRITATRSDPITVSVARWTDTEIEITRFGGAYGMGRWKLNPTDRVQVAVWNCQTGAGPAAYEFTVGDSRARADAARRGEGALILTLAVEPAIAPAQRGTIVSAFVRDRNGTPVPGVKLELIASAGGTQAPPVSVTTGSDGSFHLPFTAPPTPGQVVIRARIVGLPNSPVATAILRVVARK